MILRETLFVVAGSLFLLSSQLANAAPAASASASALPITQTEALTEKGVINGIDMARGQMVINDMVFSFSAITLKVHTGNRVSGVTSLRPNQAIRFISGVRKPGSTLGSPRTVLEIWTDKD